MELKLQSHKILALTRYGRLGASSRLRTFQYIPYLKQNGFIVEVNALLSQRFLEQKFKDESTYLEIIKGYGKRFLEFMTKGTYDIYWIEKELFPMVPYFLEGWLLDDANTSVVVDYDDAIFHNYDLHKNKLIRYSLGNKIDGIMRKADAVTVGSPYLKKRAVEAGASRIVNLPTVIDLDRYRSDMDTSTGQVTIGWIGSPSTAKYLKGIEPALVRIQRKYEVDIKIVGAKDFNLEKVDHDNCPWAEEKEVELISDFDIGIMPLKDTPWARGKCGYKLIQYMGCAKPVVASPVGVNKEIVENGKNGYLAETPSDWYEALKKLIESAPLRKEMGRKGYSKVEEEYQLAVTAPKLARVFEDLVKR